METAAAAVVESPVVDPRAWAERRGLTEPPSRLCGCPATLLDVGHWCEDVRDDELVCSTEPSCLRQLPGGPRVWDHSSVWLRDDRPAVLVFQPYGLDGDTFAGLAVLEQQGFEAFAEAKSWHLPGRTVRVEVWAPWLDQCAEVVPVAGQQAVSFEVRNFESSEIPNPHR